MRLHSNSNLGKKRYSKAQYVENAGIGVRRLSEAELERVQSHVWRLSTGAGHDQLDPQPCLMRPKRLKVPA